MNKQTRIIAHRGNYNGMSGEDENNAIACERAMINGFDVELDVILYDSENHGVFTGHDKIESYIPIDILNEYQEKYKQDIWFHAKTFDAFNALMGQSLPDQYHLFFHDKDLFTVVDDQYYWFYPNYQSLTILTSRSARAYDSILACPEMIDVDYYQTMDLSTINVFGVCTDYANMLRKELNG